MILLLIKVAALVPAFLIEHSLIEWIKLGVLMLHAMLNKHDGEKREWPQPRDE